MALPRKDEEVLELLRQIVVGINANPTLWVNPPVVAGDITTAADDLETAMQNQATQKAIAEQATAAKNDLNDAGQDINSRINNWAKGLVGNDDPRLNELGLDGPSTPQPLQPPAQPQTLESCNEKSTGEFELRWKKGSGGGAVATYKIYQKVDGAAAFTLLDAVPGNASNKVFMGQPVNVKIEAYLVASNNAGDSPQSNTVEIKL